jgi:hypothetical protein
MNHDRIMTKAKKLGAIIPRQGSQCHELLEAMFDGKKFTVLKAIDKHGVYALSQRCGQLKNKYKWPIKAYWKTLPNGKRVKEYSL